jgi:hypothetical protein
MDPRMEALEVIGQQSFQLGRSEALPRVALRVGTVGQGRRSAQATSIRMAAGLWSVLGLVVSIGLLGCKGGGTGSISADVANNTRPSVRDFGRSEISRSQRMLTLLS